MMYTAVLVYMYTVQYRLPYQTINTIRCSLSNLTSKLASLQLLSPETDCTVAGWCVSDMGFLRFLPEFRLLPEIKLCGSLRGHSQDSSKSTETILGVIICVLLLVLFCQTVFVTSEMAENGVVL